MIRCVKCGKEQIPSTEPACPNCGLFFAALHLPSGALLKEYREIDNVTNKEVTKHTYGVITPLGEGAYGITYEGLHIALSQLVAIKEFYPGAVVQRKIDNGDVTVNPSKKADYDSALKHFLKEGLLLTHVDHPNVVRVRDLFRQHGTAYLIMDYLTGESLSAMLNKAAGKKLPDDIVRLLLDQLVSALEALHNVGIYHLDIKPANVMITAAGRAVLIDLGAAIQPNLNTGLTRYGTPEYAAPELLTGKPIGAHSDLFELGMLLYQMLTGAPPPTALSRLGNDTWKPVGLAEPWYTLVDYALQMDPDKRQRSVRQWWDSGKPTKQTAPVQQAAPKAPPKAPPNVPPKTSPNVPSSTPIDRGRLIGILSVLITLILVAMVVVKPPAGDPPNKIPAEITATAERASSLSGGGGGRGGGTGDVGAAASATGVTGADNSTPAVVVPVDTDTPTLTPLPSTATPIPPTPTPVEPTFTPTPVLPTSTPAPPTPTRTLTPYPETPAGTILSVGQTWKQGGLELTMTSAKSTLYPQELCPIAPGAVASFMIRNKRDKEIVLVTKAEDFSAVTNTGVRLPVYMDKCISSGDTRDIPEVTFSVPPGGDRSVGLDWDSPADAVFYIPFDVANPDITDVVLTVDGISSIHNARWRIQNLDH